MISVCVQHHPARAGLLPELRERVPDFDLVTDPDPDGERNPLRTYLECLRLSPPTATHRIVLQDDCWPCRDFTARAEQAIVEHPDDLIAFFVPNIGAGGGRRVLQASLAGETWVEIGLGGWVPAVALAWPIEKALQFLNYLERGFLGHPSRADDEVITRYCRKAKVRVWATVPSFVEHDDEVPSLLGKKSASWRVAALYDAND